MKLIRDKTELPKDAWSFGQYRWKLTVPCSSCGCSTTITVHGIEQEIIATLPERKVLCRICSQRA